MHACRNSCRCIAAYPAISFSVDEGEKEHVREVSRQSRKNCCLSPVYLLPLGAKFRQACEESMWALTLLCWLLVCAGDEELYNAVAGPLDVMGKAKFYLGEVGNGANMKLVGFFLDRTRFCFPWYLPESLPAHATCLISAASVPTSASRVALQRQQRHFLPLLLTRHAVTSVPTLPASAACIAYPKYLLLANLLLLPKLLTGGACCPCFLPHPPAVSVSASACLCCPCCTPEAPACA
eukprot:871099-Pelagomonas_calceolata.AAC.3